MFIDFFFRMKARKIPVTTIELLDFLKVVSHISETKGISNLREIYSIARSCFIKDIKYYDDYDQAFASTFSGLAIEDPDFRSLLEQWLERALKKDLSEAQKKNAMNLTPEELFKELEERLKKQKEKHDGGNYWIGTGGTSAFGNSGFNPSGVRIAGNAGMRTGIEVMTERKYREYRTDEGLNVRQLKVALKKLKDLRKEGKKEFQLEETIQKTCDNGGDPELIFKSSRKNKMKLMLLMDVGGSMTPHAERVSKLFSAAHQMNHFKEFHYYYFHNIVYNKVYQFAEFSGGITLDRLFKKISRDTKLIMVGDASMNPYELFGATGRYYTSYLYEDSEKNISGMDSLKKITDYYKSAVWLNPDPPMYWNSGTCEAIWNEISMYYLSVDGLKKAVTKLLRD